MAFHKFSGTYKSSNRVNRIQYYIYEPESEIKGIIQISHGMYEYVEIYEELIHFFCNHGFLVCGNDHLGHGRSISSSSESGYFSKKDGWMHLVKDLKKLNSYVKRDNPKVPYYLLGHSMGSFIARVYTEYYGDSIDGAIFLGTSGTVRGLGRERMLLRAVRRMKGDHYRSGFINWLAFGSYNARYREEKDDFSWLSHNEAFRKKCGEEAKNGLIFTLGGFFDLSNLLSQVSRKNWYRRIPKNLPYLLMAGTGDPVGQYGRGVREVCRKMRRAGCLNVTMQLYKGDRHVLIQEDDKERVMNDMLAWIRRQELPR